METTQPDQTAHYLVDPSQASKLQAMVDALAAMQPAVREASLENASWIKVKYADGEHPIEGINPSQDPWGLWLTKCYEHDQEPSGYRAERVFIPWAAIKQVKVLAVVEPAEQPF